MKTFTPDLDPAVLERLREYATRFAPDFPQSKPARWAGVYLQGLLLDGERKSIEPLSHRVTLPPGLTAKDPEQALQQFVSQSPWDDQKVLTRYRALMAEPFASPDGVFVLDDTSFPKQGSALRRRPAPVLRGAGQEGQLPGRRHPSLRRPAGALPAGRAPVPARELDRRRGAAGHGGRARGVPGRQDQGPDRPGVARPGAGRGADRRHGGRRSGLRGFRGARRAGRAWVAVRRRRDRPPAWSSRRSPVGFTRRAGRGGRSPSRWVLDPRSVPPASVEAVAKGLKLRRVSWRAGTKGKLSARFAWAAGVAGSRVEARALRRRRAAVAADRGAGRRPDAVRAVEPAAEHVAAGGGAAVEERWRVEQGYQQMKEELGLDHFEGRSWRGFHHHAAMVMLAYGFLLLEQSAPPTRAGRRGKKGDTGPPLTVPGIRRALQQLLRPLARPDCPYCRDQRSSLLTE